MKKKEEPIAKIITYKGFNKDFTCRNFKYKIGKTYKTDEYKS